MSPEKSPCRSCGACCAYSAKWPRFSTETDAELARIPQELIAADLSGMKCADDRCTALTGKIGDATSCMIYEHRPEVCRSCIAGDEACRMARARHGLPMLAAA